MIEYYVLIAIGAVGLAVCFFMLGRGRKPKQQQKEYSGYREYLPPPPEEATSQVLEHKASQVPQKRENSVPSAIREFEEQFTEEEIE